MSRTKKQDDFEQMTLDQFLSEENAEKIEEESDIQIEIAFKEKEYATWEEGTEVRLIFKPDKKYRVYQDLGNIIKIKDDNSGAYNVPRSDLELVEKEEIILENK